MTWLLVFVTVVALASGFIHFYKRRLGALTGAWISGTNPKDREPILSARWRVHPEPQKKLLQPKILAEPFSENASQFAGWISEA
jgi:hypothetical protein